MENKQEQNILQMIEEIDIDGSKINIVKSNILLPPIKINNSNITIK